MSLNTREKNSMLFLVFRLNHFRSTLGIFCGPIWRSLPVLGWFGVGDHFRCCTVCRGYHTVARGHEFYVRVARTISHEWAQRTSEILFLPREHKIHVFELTCIVLFIVYSCIQYLLYTVTTATTIYLPHKLTYKQIVLQKCKRLRDNADKHYG